MTHRPIAITMGDPAGIGPEIIVRAFAAQPEVMQGCFVAGDIAHMRRATALVARADSTLAWPVASLPQPQDVAYVPVRCLPVLQAAQPAATLLAFGRVDASAGRMAAQAVVWAAQAAALGQIAAMVTAPLHKEALAAAGVAFPGHTELLQHEAARHLGCTAADLPVRMMLANGELRVVLVSIHVSLRQAIEAVTPTNLLQTLSIANQALFAALGRRPRLVVAGLNPHAGEGGLFGSEEMHIIAPAVQAARSHGLDVTGPLPPDTVFMRARARSRSEPGEFDAVIAMYHDQGLIPVKYLGMDQGVNVTLGLPWVRTSPDHGTAFDIAGSAKADPASLLTAVVMARALSADRGV